MKTINKFVYDIETIKNLMVFVFYDLKKEEFKEYILFETIWQLDELVDFLNTAPLLIGYNVLKFDGQVLQYIIENYRVWEREKLTRSEIITDIYQFVQQVITLTNNNEFPPYAEWKFTSKHIDAFTIFHFDNRAKATSLKWLQFSMDWPDLREMPIHHSEEVTESDIPDIISYCRNDVLSTNEVYNICKGKTDLKLYKGVNKMELRVDIMKEFGFYNGCMNWNDVKIGDQMNMTNYFKLTGLKDKKQLYDLKHHKQRKIQFAFKDCIPEYVQFQTEEFQDFYDTIKNEIVKTDDSKAKQEYKFKYKQTTYTIARGGIHSEDTARIVIPAKNEILRDADVGSQYPNALRKRKLFPAHLGEAWSMIIEGNIQKRIQAKKAYKETKDAKYQSINEAYKLALNGGAFGKTGEATSWQQDLFVHYSCTIGNQFEILMLIEMMEVDGISVISANTDGIVCLFHKFKENLYKENCEQWEEIVGNQELGQLEFQDYTKLIQLSVNDYLAVKPDGETKEKGDFMIDFELHKNKSFRVIPLALREYFVNNKKPENFLKEYIKKDPKHIYDYCAAIRAKGQWWFEERKRKSFQGSMFDDITSQKIVYDKTGTKLQKTVRYYISSEGSKLVKCHSDGRNIEVQAGPWVITVFNMYEEKKEWNINFNFYLEKIYTILNKLDNKITL